MTTEAPVVASEALRTTSRLTSATISISTATSTSVVAAASGQTVRVYSIILNVAGTQGVTIKDGATALTGDIALSTGGGFILDPQPDPWFITTAGNALVITTDSAVQTSGTIYYIQS